MKATYQKILLSEGSSFLATRLILPRFHSEYHFHPEYELKYVIESKGKRFVGDTIENFQEGDLILLGPNIPHYWKNDAVHDQTDLMKAKAVVVLFSEDFLGDKFFTVQEMIPIMELLRKSNAGLVFPNAINGPIPVMLEELPNSTGPLRIILMLEILAELAKAESRKLLTEEFSSGTPFLDANSPSFVRLQKVHHYVIKNFYSPLQIEDVAQIANMTPHAFCKYFKKSTKKTFMTFLNELRVCHAKKLLIENRIPISQICIESGFNNISNFNRQFKTGTNMTPSDFKAMYIN
ncbi:MAG: AraC family transcriptional regulator [Prolixibacteraceae bacterium]|nr:AraC family transcriptional regulator [Prolixibacteraceae bacterium]